MFRLFCLNEFLRSKLPPVIDVITCLEELNDDDGIFKCAEPSCGARAMLQHFFCKRCRHASMPGKGIILVYEGLVQKRLARHIVEANALHALQVRLGMVSP